MYNVSFYTYSSRNLVAIRKCHDLFTQTPQPLFPHRLLRTRTSSFWVKLRCTINICFLFYAYSLSSPASPPSPAYSETARTCRPSGNPSRLIRHRQSCSACSHTSWVLLIPRISSDTISASYISCSCSQGCTVCSRFGSIRIASLLYSYICVWPWILICPYCIQAAAVCHWRTKMSSWNKN